MMPPARELPVEKPTDTDSEKAVRMKSTRILYELAKKGFKTRTDRTAPYRPDVFCAFGQFASALQKHKLNPSEATDLINSGITTLIDSVESFVPRNKRGACEDLAIDIGAAAAALRDANGSIKEPFRKQFSSLARVLVHTSAYVQVAADSDSLPSSFRPGEFLYVSSTMKKTIILWLNGMLKGDWEFPKELTNGTPQLRD